MAVNFLLSLKMSRRWSAEETLAGMSGVCLSLLANLFTFRSPSAWYEGDSWCCCAPIRLAISWMLVNDTTLKSTSRAPYTSTPHTSAVGLSLRGTSLHGNGSSSVTSAVSYQVNGLSPNTQVRSFFLPLAYLFDRLRAHTRARFHFATRSCKASPVKVAMMGMCRFTPILVCMLFSFVRNAFAFTDEFSERSGKTDAYCSRILRAQTQGTRKDGHHEFRLRIEGDPENYQPGSTYRGRGSIIVLNLHFLAVWCANFKRSWMCP